MALVKLMLAGSHVEAQLVKGLLETEGIACVINAESRSTEMGTEAGFADITILVNEEHFEEGKLLVEAKAVSDAAQTPGAITEGTLCPVHELQATGVCSRCGTHLCAACGKSTVPLTCEACDARTPLEPRSRPKTKIVALLMLSVLLGLPIFGPALLRLFSGWLP